MASWLFADSIFRGQVMFFRDISIYYYPNYVFLERAFSQGLWPLWNPSSDAGAPFLIAYPLDIVMVLLFGAKRTLLLYAPLHVFLAMCGASVLARRLGAGTWGIWAAGSFFGASGYVLSTVNLLELLHGVAWAPWVLAALLSVFQSGTPRAVAVLAILGALQVSTLAAETVLQTALAGLCLMPRLSRLADWRRLCGAAGLALLLAAPTLLGTSALLAGTRRAEGLSPGEAFAWSATPMVLAEAVIPNLFGSVHTFSAWGFWGQAFYSGTFPYILSLYLGPIVLVLACRSGAGQRRIWLFGALGLLLALGSHGPFASALAPLLRHFRVPAKFLLLPTLALALLAGSGLDRAVRRRSSRPALSLVPAALLALSGLVVTYSPELPARALGGMLPELRGPLALGVARLAWPISFVATGFLGLGAGLALWAGPRLAPWAAVLALLDLLIVNTPLNPTTSDRFYEPSASLASLLARADRSEPQRWFSYGVANSPDLSWSPQLVWQRNTDVPLYYMERQSLLPRTHVLDGLEAAFDEELGLFAPRGATLATRDRTPSLFANHFTRLRLANVRWILSFRDLPAGLATRVAEAKFPEIGEPLGLYELQTALPRAFWVGKVELASGQQAAFERGAAPELDPRQRLVLESAPTPAPAPSEEEGEGHVSYQALDIHTVRLHVSGPPGWVVLLDGYHPDWRSDDGAPIARAYGRYRALRTPGGDRTFTLRYVPPWRGPALAAVVLGAAAVLGLLVRSRVPAGEPARDRGIA